MKKTRRCCRNCIHFVPVESACYEGGYSDIGNPERVLTEEDCNGFRERG